MIRTDGRPTIAWADPLRVDLRRALLEVVEAYDVGCFEHAHPETNLDYAINNAREQLVLTERDETA